MIERFDRKDPALHFRELAHLRQTSSTKAYISEFQQLVVMVTYILETQLIMLFIEGLADPLRGWVRSYRPKTLQDAISRARYMINALPKTKAPIPIRHTVPQGGQDTRQIHREVRHG